MTSTSSFWDLITAFPIDAGPSALITALAGRSPDEIIAFSEELARALHDLDTPAHFGQPVQDVCEPADHPALPMSADVFLYARCAVVAAGPDAWARVVADPTALAGRWAVAEGEDLLKIAPAAYEQATGRAWDPATAVSVETGSNTAAWSETRDGGDQSQGAHPSTGSKWWQWLMSGPGFDLGVEGRPVYDWVTQQLQQAIRSHPDWQSWWATAGVADLELYPFYRHGPLEAPRVRKRRKVVGVECSFDAARLQPTDHPTLTRHAGEDLLAQFEMVRAKLKLGPVPALPPIPPIPAQTPDTYPREDGLGSPEELLAMLLAAGVPIEEARETVAQTRTS